jgi:hypothetical protein
VKGLLEGSPKACGASAPNAKTATARGAVCQGDG